jgi:hypothetical protein
MLPKAWIAVIAAMAGLGAAMGAGAQSPATQPAPAAQPAPATRPAPATQPTTQPSPEVLALIEQMGAEKFQARVHAQAELVKMGAAAEPALKAAASDSPSAEIRARATAAVSEIDQNLADAPTYITLHVKDAKGGDVLKEFTRQAKVRVMGWPEFFWNGQAPGLIPPVTLDLDHVPFWEAIRALCKVTRTHPQFIGQGQPSDISLVQGNSGEWDVQGRFAFEPTSISHDSSVDLINGGANRNDALAFTVFIDPKLHSASIDPPHLTVAEDEHGTSLLPPDGANAAGFYSQGFQQMWSFTANAPLAFPANFGHTLARLEGTVTVHVPMDVQMLKIPDLAKAVGTTTTAGNRMVDVVSCSMNGNNILALHLSISKLGHSGGPIEPGGLFQDFQQARVIDARGTQLNLMGGGTGSDTTIDWQGQCNSGGRPLKPPFSLQWEITTKIESVTVPFKFKDLPLPPQ